MSRKGRKNFGGRYVENADIENASIVVLPLCYENAVSYGTGAGEGPCHLLDASEQLEDLDEETLVDWTGLGIHTALPIEPSGGPEEAVGAMKAAALAYLERHQFLLSIGGDHSVSIGPIMAAAEIHPDIGVLQFDAHTDLRDSWNGSRYNHACVMRRVADDMNLPFAQAGIRSFSSEEAAFIREKGFSPFFAHEIDPFDHSWIDRVLDMLPEKIYFTIDLDGLDPSVIPGTGTPEPGGLSYRQLVELIKAAGRRKKVVAADITELSKIAGTQVSEYTAAKIAVKIMVHCAMCKETTIQAGGCS